MSKNTFQERPVYPFGGEDYVFSKIIMQDIGEYFLLDKGIPSFKNDDIMAAVGYYVTWGHIIDAIWDDLESKLAQFLSRESKAKVKLAHDSKDILSELRKTIEKNIINPAIKEYNILVESSSEKKPIEYENISTILTYYEVYLEVAINAKSVLSFLKQDHDFLKNDVDKKPDSNTSDSIKPDFNIKGMHDLILKKEKFLHTSSYNLSMFFLDLLSELKELLEKISSTVEKSESDSNEKQENLIKEFFLDKIFPALKLLKTISFHRDIDSEKFEKSLESLTNEFNKLFDCLSHQERKQIDQSSDVPDGQGFALSSSNLFQNDTTPSDQKPPPENNCIIM